jgi:MOSC domain-containing protein YiiM
MSASEPAVSEDVPRLVGVSAGATRTEPKADLGAGVLYAGYGLLGDAHAGLSERQVSLLAIESIERANREHGISAGPGSFAENLTTQGLDLLALHVGDRLRVGPALLEVVQIGKPPQVSHTYNYQGVSILPQEGVFCRVLEGGRVAGGDVIEVIRRERA